jgi:hypothetical protein
MSKKKSKYSSMHLSKRTLEVALAMRTPKFSRKSFVYGWYYCIVTWAVWMCRVWWTKMKQKRRGANKV